MKSLKFIVALTALVLRVNCGAVIFEKDNRIEAQTETTPFWREKAKSVAAFIPNQHIQKCSNGSYKLKGHELEKAPLQFCSDSKFANQKIIANCTGSLISERHVLTAAHCIDIDNSRNRGCQDYKIAFDYATDHNGDAPIGLRTEDVFECKKIVYRRFDIKNFTEDLAIIELDRKVSNRRPLTLNFDIPEQGTPLAMIGHPLGIPQKFTDDAEILESQASKVSFRHNLETFSVNSGGPIFNAQTGDQIGVLVRGTGTNTSRVSGRDCYDWSVGGSDDFAESNDLSPLKRIYETMISKDL